MQTDLAIPFASIASHELAGAYGNSHVTTYGAVIAHERIEPAITVAIRERA